MIIFSKSCLVRYLEQGIFLIKQIEIKLELLKFHDDI